MFQRNSAIFSIDFAAVTAGILIAAPFALILSAPYIAGY